MVQANAQALSAPYAALQQAGQEVQRSAQVAASYAHERRRLQDNAGIARLRIQSAELESSIQDKLANEDPKKWEKVAENAWRSQRNSIKWEDLELSSEARKFAEIDLDAAQSKQLAAVRSQYVLRKIQEDNAALRASAKDFARNGDVTAAVGEVEKMNLSPERKEEVKTQVLEQGEYEGALEDLRAVSDSITDARSFLQDLDAKDRDGFINYPHLTQNARRSVRNATERSITQAQGEFYNELLLDVQRGNILEPHRVEQLKASGELTAGQAQNYLNGYHSTRTPFNPTQHADLRRRINNYDPDQDPNGEGYSRLLGEMLGYPDRVVTDLRNELNSRSQKDSGSLQKRRVGDRLTHLFNNGFFSDGIKPTDGMITEEELQEANMTYLRIQEKADELSQRFPDAKDSEILDMLLSGGGEATELVNGMANRLLYDTRNPVSSRTDRDTEGRNAYFRGLQNRFPALEPGMSYRDAVQAVGQEGLSSEDLQRLKRYYAPK